MPDEIDVKGNLIQLKGQHDALAAHFVEVKAAHQKVSAALNAAKAELTEFNNKYGRVLTLLEE